MEDVSPLHLMPRLSIAQPSREVSYYERRLRWWMLGVVGALVLVGAGCWTLVFWPLS